MNPTLAAPTAATCPNCGQPLIAVRRPRMPDEADRLRAGEPLPPSRTLVVWQCPICQPDRSVSE